MNTFVGTTDATFRALPPPSIFGLWAGSVPTTLQPPATNKHTHISTVVGLTLASMLGGIGVGSHELPPTFADTARIITSSSIIERNSSTLFGYKISQSQVAFVNEYLHQHLTSRNFLHDVAVIIDCIYGSKVIRVIHVVEDVDTGKPIMELTIKSGLPLDDDFNQKDQLLFQRIEASGLALGLSDVIISQG
jgi:hypothetical protein